MVCGGFACSKNCLCALNLLYTVRRGAARGASGDGVWRPGLPRGAGGEPCGVCLGGAAAPRLGSAAPPEKGAGARQEGGGVR